MISHDLMAPIMFGGLIVFLLLGYPAAFSLGAVGLFFSFIGIEMGMFQPTFLQALPDRVFGDRKSTRLNSSHVKRSRMPSSA